MKAAKKSFQNDFLVKLFSIISIAGFIKFADQLLRKFPHRIKVWGKLANKRKDSMTCFTFF